MDNCYYTRRAHLVSFPQITVSMENILPIGCVHEDMRAIAIAVYFLWHNLVHATLAPWYCRVARRRCRVRHSIHTCHLSFCGCARVGWEMSLSPMVSSKLSILLGRLLAHSLHTLLHQAFEWIHLYFISSSPALHLACCQSGMAVFFSHKSSCTCTGRVFDTDLLSNRTCTHFHILQGQPRSAFVFCFVEQALSHEQEMRFSYEDNNRRKRKWTLRWSIFPETTKQFTHSNLSRNGVRENSPP